MERRTFLMSTLFASMIAVSAKAIAFTAYKKPTNISIDELYKIVANQKKAPSDFQFFWGVFCAYCEWSIQGSDVEDGLNELLLNLNVDEKQEYFYSITKNIKNNEEKYLLSLKHLLEKDNLL